MNNLMYFAGKRVAVIGGGDNAFESVFSLERVSAHIDLVVRSEIRAQGWLQDKLRDSLKADRVTLHAPANIRHFRVTGEGVQLVLEPNRVLNVHHVIARTGFTPANALLDKFFPMLARDEQGYLIVDPHSVQTNTKGIYAVGDVCNPVNPCVATAIAHGTIAARSIEQRHRSTFHPLTAKPWEIYPKAV
jgi:thioredoxin reductase (NADPH)